MSLTLNQARVYSQTAAIAHLLNEYRAVAPEEQGKRGVIQGQINESLQIVKRASIVAADQFEHIHVPRLVLSTDMEWGLAKVENRAINGESISRDDDRAKAHAHYRPDIGTPPLEVARLYNQQIMSKDAKVRGPAYLAIKDAIPAPVFGQVPSLSPAAAAADAASPAPTSTMNPPATTSPSVGPSVIAPTPKVPAPSAAAALAAAITAAYGRSKLNRNLPEDKDDYRNLKNYPFVFDGVRRPRDPNVKWPGKRGREGESESGTETEGDEAGGEQSKVGKGKSAKKVKSSKEKTGESRPAKKSKPDDGEPGESKPVKGKLPARPRKVADDEEEYPDHEIPCERCARRGEPCKDRGTGACLQCNRSKMRCLRGDGAPIKRQLTSKRRPTTKVKSAETINTDEDKSGDERETRQPPLKSRPVAARRRDNDEGSGRDIAGPSATTTGLGAPASTITKIGPPKPPKSKGKHTAGDKAKDVKVEAGNPRTIAEPVKQTRKSSGKGATVKEGARLTAQEKGKWKAVEKPTGGDEREDERAQGAGLASKAEKPTGKGAAKQKGKKDKGAVAPVDQTVRRSRSLVRVSPLQPGEAEDSIFHPLNSSGSATPRGPCPKLPTSAPQGNPSDDLVKMMQGMELRLGQQLQEMQLDQRAVWREMDSLKVGLNNITEFVIENTPKSQLPMLPGYDRYPEQDQQYPEQDIKLDSDLEPRGWPGQHPSLPWEIHDQFPNWTMGGALEMQQTGPPNQAHVGQTLQSAQPAATRYAEASVQAQRAIRTASVQTDRPGLSRLGGPPPSGNHSWEWYARRTRVHWGDTLNSPVSVELPDFRGRMSPHPSPKIGNPADPPRPPSCPPASPATEEAGMPMSMLELSPLLMGGDVEMEVDRVGDT